ncbi:MAG: HAD domain-containing protein, partial [bacterium]
MIERELRGTIRRRKEHCDADRRVPGVLVEEVTRRVIFLDIDGVLAPIRRWDRYGDLEPACIQVLNEIVARAGADVVVSSTWRHGKTVAELQEILQAEG